MYRRGSRITRHNWNDTRRIHVGLAQCGGPLLCRHPARLRLSLSRGNSASGEGHSGDGGCHPASYEARALPLTMTTLMLCPSPQFLRGAPRLKAISVATDARPRLFGPSAAAASARTPERLGSDRRRRHYLRPRDFLSLSTRTAASPPMSSPTFLDGA